MVFYLASLLWWQNSWPKSTCREKSLFGLYFRIINYHGGKPDLELKKQVPWRQELKQSYGQMQLTAFFLMVCLVSFLIHPRNTCPRVALPRVAPPAVSWAWPHHSSMKKMPPLSCPQASLLGTVLQLTFPLPRWPKLLPTWQKRSKQAIKQTKQVAFKGAKRKSQILPLTLELWPLLYAHLAGK